jgi:hypothetical protein
MQHEIARPVVVRAIILMIRNFIRRKIPTENNLHHQAMLEHPAALATARMQGRVDQHVAMFVQGATALPFRMRFGRAGAGARRWESLSCL